MPVDPAHQITQTDIEGILSRAQPTLRHGSGSNGKARFSEPCHGLYNQRSDSPTIWECLLCGKWADLAALSKREQLKTVALANMVGHNRPA
jgi:hypothetical protein